MDIATTWRHRSSPGKKRFWQTHIEAHQRSGLSVSGYCREQGLARGAFDYWQRKLTSAPVPGVSEPPSVTIVPLSLNALRLPESPPGLQPSSLLCLTVAGRFRIEIGDDFSASVLEKLVATLERLT